LLQSAKQPRAYYISIHGNDNDFGTINNPLRTISKVNRLKLIAGDTLNFKGEQEFIGTLKLNVNTKQNMPLIITSYGAGRATINGRRKEAIILKGNNFALKNINAKGWGRKGGNTTNGISITAEDFHIETIQVEGFQKSGLQLFNCKRAIIKNVKVRYNGFCGIYVTGSTRESSKNITLQDCLAYNNPGDPTNLTNHSGNGILVGFSDSVLIDHSTATNNGWDMPRKGSGPVGIWAY
jgi:Right handed beta helix region